MLLAPDFVKMAQYGEDTMNPMVSELTAFDAQTEVESEAYSEREPALDTVQALRLSSRLQSTLDVGTLIDAFARELARMIKYDSVSYLNEAVGLSRQIGNPARHSLRYRMVLPDREILGMILVTRARPFEDTDIAMIEFLISNTVYPLRNALLYHDAQSAAFKDALTGFNNRAMFELTLEREVSLAQRHQTPLSILCIDIDHFKKINDLHGHMAGDKVIRSVAEGIHNCVRGSDVIFRYGGEEFVVVLSNTEIVGSCNLAERIRERISNSFCLHNSQSLAVTVSIGVTTLGNDKTWPSLFERADQALYQAKRTGRNKVCTL